jgi:hypothetical protein
LWADVTDSYDLGPDEFAALREAARCMDELDDLRAALRADQLTVEGSAGQPRANPLLDEVRKHRLVLDRLLERLGLPAGDEDQGMTPTQRRAQRAAQQRWRDRQAARDAQKVARDGVA